MSQGFLRIPNRCNIRDLRDLLGFSSPIFNVFNDVTIWYNFCAFCWKLTFWVTMSTFLLNSFRWLPQRQAHPLATPGHPVRPFGRASQEVMVKVGFDNGNIRKHMNMYGTSWSWSSSSSSSSSSVHGLCTGLMVVFAINDCVDDEWWLYSKNRVRMMVNIRSMVKGNWCSHQHTFSINLSRPMLQPSRLQTAFNIE